MNRIRQLGPKDQGKRDLWLVGLLTVPLIVIGFVWAVLAGGFAEPQPTPTPASTPVTTPGTQPSASPEAFILNGVGSNTPPSDHHV